jgi:ubiquinone biosynthesis protein UbiJ
MDLGGVITLGDMLAIGGAVAAPMGWAARRVVGKVDAAAEAIGDLSKLAASQCEVNRATAHLLEAQAVAAESQEQRLQRVESRLMPLKG